MSIAFHRSPDDWITEGPDIWVMEPEHDRVEVQVGSESTQLKREDVRVLKETLERLLFEWP